MVAALTVAVFVPTLGNGFVNWDDPQTLLDNLQYRGLGWARLRWMFTTFHMNHYIPLTWLTLGADYVLWGMNPAGYHLTSLVLHAAAAVAFFFVARHLLAVAMPAAPGEGRGLDVAAGLAAVLFAVHPLRVESVAWATERRDVLSGLFFLLAVLAYLRAWAATGRGARRGWLAGSVAAFGIALLSKAIVMTLPLVLLALDAYPLRRLGRGDRRVWLEKVPFVVLAVAGAVVAIVAVTSEAVLAPLGEHSIGARVAVAAYGLLFYLRKTLVPVGLSPFYPLPRDLDPLALPFLLSGAAVVAVTAAVVVVRRRWPGPLVAWFCYAVLLAPVLGLTQQGEQIVADRYSYLPMLGWMVVVGGGWLALWRVGAAGARIRAAAPLAAALVVIALGVATWRQTGVWHDSVSLWTRVLAVEPDAYLAHYNLGNALRRERRLAEAADHYRRSLALQPAQPAAHLNLALALTDQGRRQEAAEHLERALAFEPANPDAHYRLGNVLLAQRRYDVAAGHFRQAIASRPAFAEAHNNLGIALAEQGRLDEAIGAYREAIRLRPAHANARANLGNALLARGRPRDAIAAYREALGVDARHAGAYFGLGLAYLELGERGAATEAQRQLQGLDAGLAERLRNLIAHREVSSAGALGLENL